MLFSMTVVSHTHVFQLEQVGDCWNEVMVLAKAHFAEVSHAPVREFIADRSVYESMERNGCLRVYTVRDGDDLHLVGYCAMILRRHHHHGVMQASEDLIYVEPAHRAIGWSWIRWMDKDMIETEHAQIIIRAVTTRHDHSRLFLRMGYHLDEMLYARITPGA